MKIVTTRNDPAEEALLEKQLYRACLNGNAEEVAALLKTGADPNTVEAEYGQIKASLLGIAADKGYCDILSLLIAAGADVNLRDSSGRTPLHIVSENITSDRLVTVGGSGQARAIQGQTGGRDQKGTGKNSKKEAKNGSWSGTIKKGAEIPPLFFVLTYSYQISSNNSSSSGSATAKRSVISGVVVLITGAGVFAGTFSGSVSEICSVSFSS